VIKQLRMSEANLERRLSELRSEKEETGEEDNREADGRIEALQAKYEGLLQECQDSNQKDLEDLAESVNQVIKDLNLQVSQLTHQLQSTEASVHHLTNQNDRWVQSFSLISTLALTLLNKWTSLLNIKNCLSCLFIPALQPTKYSQTLKFRFKVAAQAALFMIRVSKASKANMQRTADLVRADHPLVNTIFSNDLLSLNHFYKAEAGALLKTVDGFCSDNLEVESVDGQIENLLLVFFTLNRTQIHHCRTARWESAVSVRASDEKLGDCACCPIVAPQSPTFRARVSSEGASERSGEQPEHVDMIMEYKRRLSAAGTLLGETLALLKQKDSELSTLAAMSRGDGSAKPPDRPIDAGGYNGCY
jgi:hypothetical protein